MQLWGESEFTILGSGTREIWARSSVGLQDWRSESIREGSSRADSRTWSAVGKLPAWESGRGMTMHGMSAATAAAIPRGDPVPCNIHPAGAAAAAAAAAAHHHHPAYSGPTPG